MEDSTLTNAGEHVHRRKSRTATTKISLAKVYPGGSDSTDVKTGEDYPAGQAVEYVAKPGWLRVAMALTVCLCLGWSVWLILLNVAPNNTVNGIMNTEAFDYGSFWLMVDPPEALMIAAANGLVVVAVGYLIILIRIVKCRGSAKRAYIAHQVPDQAKFLAKAENALKVAAAGPSRNKVVATIVKLAAALANEDSQELKIAKLLIKFGDLTLETFLLYQMLESGSPTVLIAIFTSIVVSNALMCAAMMFVPYERAPLAESIIDVMFDFLIAIGCPMLTLCYCLSTFSFDRAKFAINLAVFPAGWFEQGARVVANPVQIAIISKSLKSLRIMSALDFLSRIGVNATLCYRLRHVVGLLNSSERQHSSVYPKRSRIGAFGLALWAVLLVVFVEESMRTSALACATHPECVVNARRWTVIKSGSLTQCPCLTMIDRDIAPKTFADWTNPTNVTDKVIQLATTRDLQTLQITNRYLAELPEELRRCKNLKHLSLEYTHTQTLPVWVKEFTNLEYLHLESKFTSPMSTLPEDTFDGMSSLTFIHFSAFTSMTNLPSFDGLTNLKSITLACLLSLEELPPFNNLGNLERLVLSSMPAMDSLPDLSPVADLKSFAVADRGAWCCNGFIGECDLEDRKCGIVHPVWGTPAATCLASNRTEKMATATTIELVKKFASTTCGPVLEAGVLEGPPTEEIMDPCNGTLYRQCPRSDNVESMCYNARFMAIACTTNPYPIEMRRRQIAQGVGDKCDLENEAWLGCK